MCRLAPLAAALLVACCAARCDGAAPLDQMSVLQAAENGTVPLNTLLIAMAQSPPLAGERGTPDPATSPPIKPRFGPFGQILELEGKAPHLEEAMIVETEPLTPLDFERARFLPVELPPDGVKDPLNSEEYFQGDIVMPVSDFVALNEDNAVIEPRKLWPDGKIYYALSGQFTAQEKAVIASAVAEFEKHTCLQVVPLPPGPTNRDFVRVVKNSGCYSSVGRQGGGRGQELSLGKGCVYKGIVMHEFMHAAGFWHEQSRPDRDEHVIVHFDNIKPMMSFNFKKYDWDKVQNLGVGYDVGSIMHYGRYAFARDRSRPTLTARRDTGVKMGQRKGFSQLDIRKLNRLYSCDDATTTTTTPPTTGGSGTCKDMNQSCTYWAKRGECSRNPSYMHKNCQLSCNKCTDGGCKDMNRSCLDWASRGECSRNPSYMHVYCREACKLCQSTCKNNHRLCEYWSEQNECIINPNYMHVECKVSCDTC